MAKRIIFLPLIILSLIVFSSQAYSDVLIEDSREDAINNNSDTLTFGEIETGAGEAGNYVVIACAIDNENGNIFNLPAPLNWVELDQGLCGGQERCRHGIWGGFVDNPNSQSITCSWSDTTVLFVSGSMRYTGVDPFSPVTGIECDTGTGPIATAPSIDVPGGAQVLRVYTAGTGFDLQGAAAGNDIASRAEEQDFFVAVAASIEFSRTIAIRGDSVLKPLSGPTGTAQFDFGGENPDWRACTIGIRMIILRDVPTMSEWGLIGFAAFAGIAGVWYLRRKAKA